MESGCLRGCDFLLTLEQLEEYCADSTYLEIELFHYVVVIVRSLSEPDDHSLESVNLMSWLSC